MRCLGGLQHAVESSEVATAPAQPQLNDEVRCVHPQDPLAPSHVTTEGRGYQPPLVYRQSPVEAETALGAALTRRKVKVQEAEVHRGAPIVDPRARLVGFCGNGLRKF